MQVRERERVAAVFCICSRMHMPLCFLLTSLLASIRGVVLSSRLVQYGSKTVSWVLELEGVSADLVKKIRSLESSISTARKRKLRTLQVYDQLCTSFVTLSQCFVWGRALRVSERHYRPSTSPTLY